MGHVLQEVNLLKQFLKSLGLSKAKKQAVPPGKSELSYDTTDLVTKVLTSLKIKHSKAQVQASHDALAVKYPITINGTKYILKAYTVIESGQFNLILWSRDQQELIDAIAIGNIKDQKYRLRAIAKQRLAKWVDNDRT